MASTDFASARFGFFVALIGLAGASYYAFTLRTELTSQKNAVAQYANENGILQSNIEKLNNENGVNVQNLATCNKALAEAEVRLSEIKTDKAPARKK